MGVSLKVFKLGVGPLEDPKQKFFLSSLRELGISSEKVEIVIQIVFRIGIAFSLFALVFVFGVYCSFISICSIGSGL